jgi:hypothetical protein
MDSVGSRVRPGARLGAYTRRVIGPAPVFAVLLGIFHTGLYVLIRGTAGGRLPLLLVAASLGAWAGDALGSRLGVDVLRVGDFRLVAASAVAWLGIGVIALVSVLAPSRGNA